MPSTKKTVVADKVEINPIIGQQTENPATDQQEKAVQKNKIAAPVPATSEEEEEAKTELKKNKVHKTSTTREVVAFPTQESVDDIHKIKFKQLHTKDIYWLENDIYQTLLDITKGDKKAKALVINQALKDYLKKKKIAIKPLEPKDK